MKNNSTKEKILQSLAYMLVPLVRVLISFDIKFSDVTNVLKRVYVYVATHYDIDLKGKKTDSAIEKKIGISRKYIPQIKQENIDNPLVLQQQFSIPGKIISAWLRNDLYIDEDKDPIAIAQAGSVISFQSLVNNYTPGANYLEVLEVLKEMHVVSFTSDGRVKLIAHQAIPLDRASRFVAFAPHFSYLLNTARINTQKEPTESNFERAVMRDSVPIDVVMEFKAYSEIRSMELLVEYNKFIEEKMAEHKHSEFDERARVGVGIYYFDNLNKRK